MNTSEDAIQKTSTTSWITVAPRHNISDSDHSDKPLDALSHASLVYLTIPFFIFLAGWLKPIFSLALITLLFLAIHHLYQGNSRFAIPNYSRQTWLAVIIVGLLWSSFGGAGHLHYANPDWLVRDAVLGDLIYTDWPPAYATTDGIPIVLRTAFGYFLPAALIGKTLGTEAADIFLFIWTSIGVILFLLLLPLPKRAGIKLAYWLLGVIFFSGMDLLGIILAHNTLPVFPLRLEWWVPFSYSSLSGLIYWAPNHAIPIMISTVLFYRHWCNPRFLEYLAILIPIASIWTPFMAPAILPFVTYYIYYLAKKRKSFHIGWLPLINAIALIYVSARWLTLDYTQVANIPTEITGSATNQSSSSSYFMFITMEFGLLAMILATQLRHSLGLLLIATGVLTLLPFFEFGPSNDLLLRLSIPPLVILMILTFRTIETPNNPKTSNLTRWVTIGILVVGSATPIVETWRAASWQRWAPNYRHSLIEQQNGYFPPHYVGRLDRKDLVMLFKTTNLVPRAQERPTKSN